MSKRSTKLTKHETPKLLRSPSEMIKVEEAQPPPPLPAKEAIAAKQTAKKQRSQTPTAHRRQTPRHSAQPAAEEERALSTSPVSFERNVFTDQDAYKQGQLKASDRPATHAEISGQASLASGGDGGGGRGAPTGIPRNSRHAALARYSKLDMLAQGEQIVKTRALTKEENDDRKLRSNSTVLVERVVTFKESELSKDCVGFSLGNVAQIVCYRGNGSVIRPIAKLKNVNDDVNAEHKLQVAATPFCAIRIDSDFLPWRHSLL